MEPASFWLMCPMFSRKWSTSAMAPPPQPNDCDYSPPSQGQAARQLSLVRKMGRKCDTPERTAINLVGMIIALSPIHTTSWPIPSYSWSTFSGTTPPAAQFGCPPPIAPHQSQTNRDSPTENGGPVPNAAADTEAGRMFHIKIKV